jgi:hypothetical protein
LKENGICPTVKNFGVGAFQSSMELIKFQDLLRRVPETRRPTIAIFYDGYNDSSYSYMCGAGNMQRDLSNKLRLLVEKDHKDLLQYVLLSWLAEHSILIRDYALGRMMPATIYEGFPNDGSKQNLAASVSVYLTNTRFIRAVCREFGIVPLFVLQPIITSKQGLTEFEKTYLDNIERSLVEFVQSFYEEVTDKMIAEGDFTDLSSLLDHDGVSDFYDFGHTGPLTSAVIGREIGRQVLTLINRRDKGLITIEQSSPADQSVRFTGALAAEFRPLSQEEPDSQ